LSELCGTNDEKRIGVRKKTEKEISRSAVEIEWCARKKRDRNNNNPQYTTVSNSVKLSIRFLAPCFYANICEIQKKLGLRRGKRTMSKDNGDN